MDNIKTFLIFGLLATSMLLWSAWEKDYGVRSQMAATDQVADDIPSQTAADDSLPTAEAIDDLSSLPALDDGGVAATPQPEGMGGLVRVKTDTFDIEINLQGAGIQRLALSNYPQQSSEPDLPVQLMDNTSDNFFVTQTGLRSQATVPNHYDTFTTAQTRYTLAAGADSLTVPFQWQGEDGVTVTKTYTFTRDSYQIKLDYQIENNSAAALSVYPYAQFNRKEPSDKRDGFVYTYTGAVFSVGDEAYEKVDFGDLEDEGFNQTASTGWAAMIQHYFVAAWLPHADEQGKTFYGKALEGGNFTSGVKMPTLTVAQGEMAETGFRLYAGPKEHARLTAAAENLDLAVDYGMFTIIAKPLFWLLEWFHKLTGNWGWAIMLLTISVKALFFQLSAKSYRSMASMRKLTPKLAALKERHGDDKQAYSKSMMELYRTEKINPLSGCWPILLQMPVFLSLYWVLVESVEIRQAPFILWLQDLTAMDPYFVLPVIFGLSMFFQQKLNPPPQDPAQAMMMKAFPLIFTVFFAFFPSGLVLYWVVNNLLSIAQQWYITRKLGAL
jgi:YidC/Oxa1 family membrane protein insertase